MRLLAPPAIVPPPEATTLEYPPPTVPQLACTWLIPVCCPPPEMVPPVPDTVLLRNPPMIFGLVFAPVNSCSRLRLLLTRNSSGAVSPATVPRNCTPAVRLPFPRRLQ